MNKLAILFFCIIVFLFSACSNNDEPKIDPTLILGQWELIDTDDSELKIICEFNKCEDFTNLGIFKVYEFSDFTDKEKKLRFEGGWRISSAHYTEGNKIGYFDILITDTSDYYTLTTILEQFHLNALTKKEMIWIRFGENEYRYIRFIRK